MLRAELEHIKLHLTQSPTRSWPWKNHRQNQYSREAPTQKKCTDRSRQRWCHSADIIGELTNILMNDVNIMWPQMAWFGFSALARRAGCLVKVLSLGQLSPCILPSPQVTLHWNECEPKGCRTWMLLSSRTTITCGLSTNSLISYSGFFKSSQNEQYQDQEQDLLMCLRCWNMTMCQHRQSLPRWRLTCSQANTR